MNGKVIYIFRPKKELLEFIEDKRPALKDFSLDESHVFLDKITCGVLDEVRKNRVKVSFLLSRLVDVPDLLNLLSVEGQISVFAFDKLWDYEELEIESTFENLCDFTKNKNINLDGFQIEDDEAIREWVSRFTS